MQNLLLGFGFLLSFFYFKGHSMYHLYRVVLSRLPPGWDDMFLNAFKCNLNELTKSTLLPEVCGHSTCACPVVCYSCTTFMWFSGVEIFLCAALSMLPDFFKPSSSPLPPLPIALSPLMFFSVMWACFCFLFVWGLMAGLGHCASHQGVIQSRYWLPKVGVPGCSRQPTSF